MILEHIYNVRIPVLEGDIGTVGNIEVVGMVVVSGVVVGSVGKSDVVVEVAVKVVVLVIS